MAVTVKLDRKLIVNVEEAATVRLIFSRYLDLGSVSALQRDLIRPPAGLLRYLTCRCSTLVANSPDCFSARMALP